MGKGGETHLGQLDELGDELVVDGGVDVDSLDSTASASQKEGTVSQRLQLREGDGRRRVNRDERTKTQNSRLSRIKERSIDQLIHRILQIRILPYIRRILPSQLQPNAFKVLPSSGSLIDSLPSRHGPSERDERDGGRSDEFEGGRLIESEDLEGCWRETGGEEGLLKTGCRGRGLRGGLDEDGVS